MERIVIVAALICVAPVVFGLIVAKWDRRWSRASRSGTVEQIDFDAARYDFEQECG